MTCQPWARLHTIMYVMREVSLLATLPNSQSLVQTHNMSKFMREEEGDFWVGYLYDLPCRTLPKVRAQPHPVSLSELLGFMWTQSEDPREQTGGVLTCLFPSGGILRESPEHRLQHPKFQWLQNKLGGVRASIRELFTSSQHSPLCIVPAHRQCTYAHTCTMRPQTK